MPPAEPSRVSGTVRLGAITTAYKDPLPTLLREFRAGHPDVVIQATEIDTHEGRPGVLDGRLDVALVRQVPSDKALQTLALRRDHLVAAVPASHPLAAAHDLPLDLSEARDERWVWLPGASHRITTTSLVAACRRYGFSPIATHMATSIDSQLAMVGCGLGITVIPHTATVGAPDGVVVRPLTKRCEPGRAVAAVAPRRVRSTHARTGRERAPVDPDGRSRLICAPSL